ncbi:MAG: hypothetical protein V4597_11545 [Pseudomonadota bacterium]
MASQGPLSPSVGTDVSFSGAFFNWSTPGNITAQDNTYATDTAIGDPAAQNIVSLVKGGTVSGSNLSTGATIPATDTDTYTSFGGTSNLWGLTLAVADVNASNFGWVASLAHAGSITHYLQATGFGFTIPTGATINGVLAEVDWSGGSGTHHVDHMRLTVYYTPVGGLLLRRRKAVLGW